MAHPRKLNGIQNPAYLKHRKTRRMYWINKYKKAKGCIDCGYNSHAVALDFDHIDRMSKEFNPSSKEMTRRLKSITREIRKCVIRCSNCHRVSSHLNNHYQNIPERLKNVGQSA